ncbi:MAG TPA: trypsin-like peptidase domain-containing protein [Methylomirabilota bacterium]|jgi:serine protease Do|nr:trypsin-like peptidase domain-containing protein [Methylomirabilota bacterium]
MPPRSRALIVLTVLATSIAGCAGATAPSGEQTRLWRETPAATAAPELVRFNDLLADLAERLKPALVHVRVRRGGAPARDDSDSPGEPRRSTGSGFLIEPTGMIVTNAHVVEQAEWIQVRLSDGRRFGGRIVGLDSRVDLALVKIDATDLPSLPLGDSNRLRVGEFVLALGHPFGLEQSVSFGIVSRKGAPLTVAAPGFDFIQTDAAINPGNSGGPLVNMAGQVIGVNSMAARNGSIGFAIPSNLVKLLVPQLATKGKVEWGWLGVSIAEVTDEDLSRLKLREARGVLIRGVMPGEPADRGGVRADDVLVALDGTPLDTPRDLQRVVSSTPVGKQVRVRLLREGRETEVEITIGLYKDREILREP